ncbi:MAG TPA: hypothetical protein VJ986_03515 [Gaiellaceae bacterium]|nr:hypothetical protein [Gaiellaceae bacterium]
MIRHRPAGGGHPYLVEPDQRVPVRPVAGETVELRATTRAGAGDVRAELELDGRRWTVDAAPRGDAVPGVLSDYGVPAPRVGEGHLSDAVARLREQVGRVSWGVDAPLDRIPVFITAARAGALAPLFAGLEGETGPPRTAEPAEVR